MSFKCHPRLEGGEAQYNLLRGCDSTGPDCRSGQGGVRGVEGQEISLGTHSHSEVVLGPKPADSLRTLTFNFKYFLRFFFVMRRRRDTADHLC